jgi:hypothetical protein
MILLEGTTWAGQTFATLYHVHSGRVCIYAQSLRFLIRSLVHHDKDAEHDSNERREGHRLNEYA